MTSTFPMPVATRLRSRLTPRILALVIPMLMALVTSGCTDLNPVGLGIQTLHQATERVAAAGRR